MFPDKQGRDPTYCLATSFFNLLTALTVEKEELYCQKGGLFPLTGKGARGPSPCALREEDPISATGSSSG